MTTMKYVWQHFGNIAKENERVSNIQFYYWACQRLATFCILYVHTFIKSPFKEITTTTTTTKSTSEKEGSLALASPSASTSSLIIAKLTKETKRTKMKCVRRAAQSLLRHFYFIAFVVVVVALRP